MDNRVILSRININRMSCIVITDQVQIENIVIELGYTIYNKYRVCAAELQFGNHGGVSNADVLKEFDFRFKAEDYMSQLVEMYTLLEM